MANNIVEGMLGMVMGEEVVQATANVITNEMWQLMHKLKSLKDNLVEWQNVEGIHANLAGSRKH